MQPDQLDDFTQSTGEISKQRLQELNPYVKVTLVMDQKFPTLIDYLKNEKKEGKEPFKAVVHSESVSLISESDLFEL